MNRLITHVRQLSSDLLDFVFPPCCGCCGEPLSTGIICEICASLLEKISSPRCPQCGIPFEGQGRDHLCSECIARPPAFQTTSAIFQYDGPVADGIRTLKYGPKPERIWPLSQLWKDTCPELPKVDFALAIPLHRKKLISRGFNQTVVLSKPMLRSKGIGLAQGLLERHRQGVAQAGLTVSQRKRAPRGNFRLTRRGKSRLQGKRILLLDDVMTTGSTIRECARIIQQGGASEVHVAVLARALIGKFS